MGDVFDGLKVRGRTAREHGETAVAGHGARDAPVALFVRPEPALDTCSCTSTSR